MSRKRKPICGISISRYYLDRERWSIAKLTVAKRDNGDLVWQVIKGISHYSDFLEASIIAVNVADSYGVEVFMECRKGDPVSIWTRARLNRRGLLAHLK